MSRASLIAFYHAFAKPRLDGHFSWSGYRKPLPTGITLHYYHFEQPVAFRVRARRG